MAKKRKKYTQEFRESAVKLITEQGYKNAEAARNLGINPTMLGRWKREIEGGVVGNSDPMDAKNIQAELTCLKKENNRLKLEREILKKAAAFFANESGCGIT
ncbi:MAG: transposase [Desulfobulbus sp.]|nr:transposase [Desulfobulbus sp.]